MSNIRDNLLRTHFTKCVAELIARNSTDLRCRALARDLVKQCSDVNDALHWGSVKINLRTCDRIMANYSRGAYGNPAANRLDILRLIGVAVVQLEEAIKANPNTEKKALLEKCYDTLIRILEIIDESDREDDAYVDAAGDAAVLEAAMA